MRQLILSHANLTAAVLDPLLRTDAAAPRITYYDDATAERIELSTATLANWAAKTGNLLRDEFGAGPGSRVAVLLPAHWQTAAVLLGIWWIGAEVLLGGSEDADVVMCSEDRIAEAGAIAGPAAELVVLSLDPFGRPVDNLPVGVTDYATSVRVHGDQLVAEPRPGPALDGRPVSVVLADARNTAVRQQISSKDRVMSSADWDTYERMTSTVLAVLATGASLVHVNHPDGAALERRRGTEKVTLVLD